MTRAKPHEWCRFFDVVATEDAASELRRHVTRLESVHDDLQAAASILSDAPDGDVNEGLWVARAALADAIDRLEMAGTYLWTAEPQSA